MKINLNKFKVALFGSLLVAPLLLIGTKNVQAKTVATVHSNVAYASLLTHDGFKVNNRALGSNTSWLVGKTIILNNRPYYQIDTNEYVLSSDIVLNKQVTLQKIADFGIKDNSNANQNNNNNVNSSNNSGRL